jgi:GT2 family glycosyltransferase
MSAAPAVSVVVPNFNGAAFIVDTLRSVRDQTVPATEILVVDNGSTDGSVDAIRRSFPDIRVERLPENRGFAGGANAGVRATTTPLVAVLNSDARPHPDWLASLLDVVAASDDDVWAWGSILLSSATGLIESAGDEWSPRGFAFKRQKGEPVSALAAEPYDAFAPPGASPLLRRDVFDVLGGYHDRFFLYYEDVDLAYRARRAGYRAVVVPAARVEHDLGRSGESGRSWFYVARNSLWCNVRNEPELEPRRWWRATVNDWGHAGRGGYRRPYLKGRVAGVAGLPRTLAERRALQRHLASLRPPARSTAP